MTLVLILVSPILYNGNTQPDIWFNPAHITNLKEDRRSGILKCTVRLSDSDYFYVRGSCVDFIEFIRKEVK